jgi:hypothetical protein
MQNSTGKAWAAHLPSKASGPKEAGQADGRMLARGRFDPFTTPSGNDRIYALRRALRRLRTNSNPQAVTGAKHAMGFSFPSRPRQVRAERRAQQDTEGPDHPRLSNTALHLS